MTYSVSTIGDDQIRWIIQQPLASAKVKAGLTLARKKAGLRYSMQVVPLDSRHVRGTHGLLPTATIDAPVLLCSEPSAARDRIAATEVRDLLLELAGIGTAGRV